jgi:diaminohydroxyphosphoribosylaminopyrimidine deaminase/5-amino-6-(5-phosphoribosylamino)uracil reductase
MALAGVCAEEAIGRSDPNPRVGCVLLSADGRLISTGSTQKAGEAHAEVMALRAARSAGAPLKCATAYVTLEPCSHHGRTPPCCDALVEAGIARVVVAVQDPNPQVNGRGIERLRQAGMEVQVLPPAAPAAVAARELNIGFFSRMQRGRPWVRMKIAASLDGRTALPNGVSQWITGEAARRDGHLWRKRAGAILTGIGTVKADDPRLDVRLVPTEVQPVRVVVDSRLEISPGARVLQPPGRCLVYTAVPPQKSTAAGEASRATVLGPNAQVIQIASTAATPTAAKTDLAAVMADLGARGINEVHVEAGEKLNGSLLEAGLVDELLVYLAPMLLGSGASMASLRERFKPAEGIAFVLSACQPIDGDLRLILRC